MSMGVAWELLEFSEHILQWINISENVEMKKPWREIGVGGSVLNTNPTERSSTRDLRPTQPRIFKEPLKLIA
jgi:hypothetical protein